MALQLRPMQPNDAKRLHQLYEKFTLNYVGSAKRQVKQFRGMTRKRDNMRWVALNEKSEIVGYVTAVYAKGRRTGRITEIVADTECDFETIAHSLVNKIHDILLAKGAAQIQAATIKNPDYSKIFPKLGFWRIETDGVFMYAITDVARFLGEITPVIVQRLKRLKDWNGLLRIVCESHHVMLRKEGEDVYLLLSTSHSFDCSVSLSASVLIHLLLGVTDVGEAFAEKLIHVETTLSRRKTIELLDLLFPRRQFLALDYW